MYEKDEGQYKNDALHVARLEGSIRVDTESSLVLRVVHPGLDPTHLTVTEVAVL